MTLDRRQVAILAGHLQAAIDIVVPPPGEDPPPPPDSQPGPGHAADRYHAGSDRDDSVTGITGAWEVAGVDPERQSGVRSLVVDDLVQTFGVRNQRYVIANADFALAATFTVLLVAQRRPG